MSNPPLHLAPPSPATRQVGISIAGSPIGLSRSTSERSDLSDIQSPETSLKARLLTYKTYLEHEIDFVDNEINALIQRPQGPNPVENAALLELRDNLKVRYNSIRTKLVRVEDLLSVL